MAGPKKKKIKFTKLDQRIYNTIAPVYSSAQIGSKVKGVMSLLKNEYRDLSYNLEGNELWKYALGSPDELKEFTTSKYKPSISKNKNVEYIKPINVKFDSKDIERFLNKIGDKNFAVTGDKMTGYLGDYKVSKGEDEEGKYISYYDKWNFKSKRLNKFLDRTPEIYDRIYYKDNPNYKIYREFDEKILDIFDYKEIAKHVKKKDLNLSKTGIDPANLDPYLLQYAQGGKVMAKPKRKKQDGGFLSPAELEQLGLGDWIKDNVQGVIGGLKTAAGIALTATGIGAGAGIGLIGSGIGDISGEITGDINRKNQEALDAEQIAKYEQNAYRTSKTQQLFATANANTNFQPQMLQQGGPINYTGQTHKGPQEGIQVDAQGNPTVVTGKNPVALTEGGEVGYRNPNGEVYVFPKGLAPKANKIFKQAERRLGENFDNPDPISQKGLQMSVSRLIAENEAIKNKKCRGGKLKRESGGELPEFQGDQDQTFIPSEGPELFSRTDNTPITLKDRPFSPFKGQAIGTGIQAGLGALGNIALASFRKRPEEITAPRITAPQISLVEQRTQADVDAAEARSRARLGARGAGVSKAQEQALTGVADAAITGQTGRIKSQSLLQERNINRQGQFQAAAANQQAIARADQLNALRQDQFNREQVGIYGQAISNITGGAADISRAYQDSQFLTTLGGRSGYQLVKGADGKVKLSLIPGHWTDKVKQV